MEEMHCYKCQNSRNGNVPNNAKEIDEGCKIPSILTFGIELNENRAFCRRFKLVENKEMLDAERREKFEALELEAEKINNERQNVYCPLNDDSCRRTCECYTPATAFDSYVSGVDNKSIECDPYLTKGKCTCFVLTIKRDR
jgi:protein-tyrosine phosphatase